MTVEEIREKLFALQEPGYRAFQMKLMPTVPEDSVIGVRVPALRAFAKELFRSGEYTEFLQDLPHRYYDENNLHGFLISLMKDYDSCITALDWFLPYVDNWATCDLMRPKCFARNTDRLIGDIRRWMASEHTYTLRFGIEMLMTFFLDDHFREEYPATAAEIRSDEYYVNMMIAWYFATALAKQYDAVIPYLEQHRLDTWTHRMTIRKACESFCVTLEQKKYLRTLR